MSAPLRRNASDCPTRSTPTTTPKFPARPAATPDSASSNTAASAGVTSSSCAARRNESGAGFPGDVLLAHRDTVHPLLDEFVQPGELEYLAGVGAGRHHGAAETGVGDRLQIAARSLENR